MRAATSPRTTHEVEAALDWAPGSPLPKPPSAFWRARR